MLQTIRAAIFVSLLVSVPSVFGQSPQSPTGSDFLVQITEHKTTFYYDDEITFRVMKRAGTPASPGCRFGGAGKVDVLRDGNVIATFETGEVSMLGGATLQGQNYVYYSGDFGPYSFLQNLHPFEKIEIHPENNFQFRAACGDAVSEPSRPFHISEWRLPVDGLQVFVTPLQKSYKVGEPIRVRVTMRNTGATPKRCPVPFPDDGYLRSFWALGPYWEDPRPVVDDKLFYPRSLGILKPGESRTAVFDLSGYKGKGQNKIRSLGAQPGKYLLWFSVFFDDDQVPKKYQENLWRDRELGTNFFEIVIE